MQCFQSDFKDSQASDDIVLFESDVAGITKKQKIIIDQQILL